MYEAAVFLVYFYQVLIGLDSNEIITIGAHSYQVWYTLK